MFFVIGLVCKDISSRDGWIGMGLGLGLIIGDLIGLALSDLSNNELASTSSSFHELILLNRQNTVTYFMFV